MGNIQINEELIPRNDQIFIAFGKVNYKDSFCLSLETKKKFDVDFIVLKIIRSLPKWFVFLLNLRNTIASIFGLKTGKIEDVYDDLENLDFKQDQSIGEIFIILKENNLLITELKDKYLDFHFSILIRE